jgi:hypothetical protein
VKKHKQMDHKEADYERINQQARAAVKKAVVPASVKRVPGGTKSTPPRYGR